MKTCDKIKLPTVEEVAADEAEARESLDETMIARTAIVAACGGPWKKGMDSKAGMIDCPVCEGIGTLHFSRAGYNGHIHSSCTTPGCVSWME